MKLLNYFLTFFVITFFLTFPLITQAQNILINNFTQSSFLNTFPAKIELIVGKTTYELSSSLIATWLKEETDLAYNLNYNSEIENTNFCAYKKSLLCQLTFLEENRNHIQKISFLKINSSLIKHFVKDLARQLNKVPQNAKLEIKDSKVAVFELSSPGIQLDENKSLKTLENYLTAKKHPASLKLPFKEIPPKITTESINNLGITQLIGEGRSNFAGSPSNRIHNIKVAAGRFNGVLIKPHEEFSFVNTLGAVDKEHGYLPELVIKQNKTVPEFGGGICQVSTTAFRAAINTGLEITARTNHAYPVSYYNPQGTDATVYIPNPDLRFINDTPGYILIQTKIKGTELIFDFYGTNDKRVVKIIGPKILERHTDGSMKTILTQQIFNSNGKLIREDIFNSNYASPNKYPHPTDKKTPKKKKH
jgi:vancomycin resistance protein YoaR